MNYLPFALLAYLLNAAAVTVDKLLLAKTIPNPLIYIFYISMASFLALFFLPLTHTPSVEVFMLASTSTLLWTTGAYFLYSALRVGLASRVVPVIGTLVPLTLLLHGAFTSKLSTFEIFAIESLILGLIFLTLPDWKGHLSFKELAFEVTSAILFAISYLVLREAYLKEEFLTVLVWSRLILIPTATIILALPSLRKIVLSQGTPVNWLSKTGALFVFGQLAGGVSEVLITFSVSLATPALVNSLQGTQNIFLMLFSLILARKMPDIFSERFSPTIIISKLSGISFIGLGLYILAYWK